MFTSVEDGEIEGCPEEDAKGGPHFWFVVSLTLSGRVSFELTPRHDEGATNGSR
jgi:hypothetical protein